MAICPKCSKVVDHLSDEVIPCAAPELAGNCPFNMPGEDTDSDDDAPQPALSARLYKIAGKIFRTCTPAANNMAGEAVADVEEAAMWAQDQEALTANPRWWE